MKNLIFKLSILFLFSGKLLFGQDCSHNLQEIYDFPEGSHFQYLTYISYEAPFYDSVFVTYTVENKWWEGNTLYYSRIGNNVTRVYSRNGDMLSHEYEYTLSDTIAIVDSANHRLNSCPGDTVQIHSVMNFLFPETLMKDYYSVVTTNDSLKCLGGWDNVYEIDSIGNLIEATSIFDEFNSVNYIYKYQEGVGLIESEEYAGGFSSPSYKKELLSYIIDSDTTGDFRSGLLTNIDKKENSQIVVYPTILTSEDQLNVNGGFETLTILTTDGTVVSTYYENEPILVNDLIIGSYIIKLVQNNRSYTKTIVIY